MADAKKGQADCACVLDSARDHGGAGAAVGGRNLHPPFVLLDKPVVAKKKAQLIAGPSDFRVVVAFEPTFARLKNQLARFDREISETRRTVLETVVGRLASDEEEMGAQSPNQCVHGHTA